MDGRALTIAASAVRDDAARLITALDVDATMGTVAVDPDSTDAGGSTLGALLAAEESPKPRRVVVFTGEGSLQLTAQEVSTMVRLNLKPILVVLNNDGYVSPASF